MEVLSTDRYFYYATRFIVPISENQPISVLHCRSNMDQALSWMILHDHTLSRHLSKSWGLLVPRFLRALGFLQSRDLQLLGYSSIFAFREVDRVTRMCYLKLTAIKGGKWILCYGILVSSLDLKLSNLGTCYHTGFRFPQIWSINSRTAVKSKQTIN